MKLFLILIFFNIFTVHASDTIKIEPMDTITLIPNVPFQVNNHLTIKVINIIEEMGMPETNDGANSHTRSEIIAKLIFSTDKKTEQLTICTDEPMIKWEGYEFEYIGGWRDEVILKVIKTDNDH
jgi:hypothetical protein